MMLIDGAEVDFPFVMLIDGAEVDFPFVMLIDGARECYRFSTDAIMFGSPHWYRVDKIVSTCAQWTDPLLLWES